MLSCEEFLALGHGTMTNAECAAGINHMFRCKPCRDLVRLVTRLVPLSQAQIEELAGKMAGFLSDQEAIETVRRHG